MEDKMRAVIYQVLPLLPENFDGVEVAKICSLVGEEILRRQRFDNLRDALRELSFAREEFEEDEAFARRGCGDLRFYPTFLRRAIRR